MTASLQTPKSRDNTTSAPALGHVSGQPPAAGVPRLADFSLTRSGAFISPRVFAGLVRIAEISTQLALGFVIAALYVAETDFASNLHYVVAPFMTAAVAAALNQALGLHTIPALSTPWQHLPRLLLGWTGAIGLLVAGVFFLKVGPEFSRVWLALWYLAGIAVLMLVRLAVARVTLTAVAEGRLVRRAVIYGSGPHCETLLRALEADPASDIRICGIFDDRSGARTSCAVAGYPKLGGSDVLVNFARRSRVDMVILALPLAAEARVAAILGKLWVLPVDIKLAATASVLKLPPRAYSHIGSVPMIDICDKPLDGWAPLAKDALDKVVATLALVALAPVMALVAMAIRLESQGPALFRQKRYGFNNELIEVFKFRSMYDELADAQASRLVTRDDPRVTRVGRIIRKSSLDELPQLFNVLLGTLSLVGPRPHAVQAKAADALYPDVVDGYFARHKVKPGITGWAQIHGWRGETDTPEKIQNRVAHDIWYIENWSLLLDLYILAKTPLALLKTENAY